MTGDGSYIDGLFACFAVSNTGDGSYIDGLFACFAVSNTGVTLMGCLPVLLCQ